MELAEPKYTLEFTQQYLSHYANGVQQNASYYLKSLQTQLKETEAQNKKLVEWIKKYECHALGCWFRGSFKPKECEFDDTGKCNCGLDELLKEG